jgi:hypothetical protein
VSPGRPCCRLALHQHPEVFGESFGGGSGEFPTTMAERELSGSQKKQGGTTIPEKSAPNLFELVNRVGTFSVKHHANEAGSSCTEVELPKERFSAL